MTFTALLDLDTPAAIARALDGGWPASGLAFGYIDRGLFGHWFYTLAGARSILHVSLRLRARPRECDLAGTEAVSFAHAALERYLSSDVNYAAATSTMAQSEDVLRKVVLFSEVDGVPQERQATWTGSAGLSPLTTRTEVFSTEAEAPPAMERVIWV